MIWKYTVILLLVSLIAAGCSSANLSLKSEEKSIVAVQKANVKQESKPILTTQGIITWDPINYESKQTVLYTKELRDSFSEVQYRIWRVADGESSAKVFSSKDAANNNFALPFSLQSFDWKRGEYQIDTVGIKPDGTSTPLVHSAITFQQSVPFLMYHGIDEYHGQGLRGLFVSPSTFEAHMKYLKDNGYTLLTFEHWNDINKVNKPIFITFDDGMKDNLNAFYIFKKLKDDHFTPTATAFVISSFFGKPGYLSAEEIKMMSDSGIFSIQSHTVDHANLPYVPNAEQELKDSRDKIAEVTGKPVISLAYPVGYYNDHVVELTKKYYEYAVTTKKGVFVEKRDPNEKYVINRFDITPIMTMNQFIEIVQEKK
ncbi:polysaccharide deacetylase family protein [Ectobacillus polymachus]|uniref:polysaccharide deacetylase family protein n=1 Tax=Ectobacillus polymachus TaxID=1508806 RepID=UPI003A8756DF